jgi:hypothetical protein
MCFEDLSVIHLQPLQSECKHMYGGHTVTKFWASTHYHEVGGGEFLSAGFTRGLLLLAGQQSSRTYVQASDVFYLASWFECSPNWGPNRTGFLSNPANLKMGIEIIS